MRRNVEVQDSYPLSKALDLLWGLRKVSVELPIVAISTVYLADLYKEGCGIR